MSSCSKVYALQTLHDIFVIIGLAIPLRLPITYDFARFGDSPSIVCGSEDGSVFIFNKAAP